MHHTGSIKFMTGDRRHPPAPRIPSFGQGIGENIRINTSPEPYLSGGDSDEELSDALSRLESVTIVENGVPLGSTDGSGESQQPFLTTESTYSNYSTTVIRRHSQPSTVAPLSSILTIRASPIEQPVPPPTRPLPVEPDVEPEPEPGPKPVSRRSAISAASYYTASEEVSIAAATEGGSVLLLHRFTLIKPGTIAKRLTSSSGGHASSSGWSALDFFFGSGLLHRGGGAKCDVCTKRLGRKAVLECDDCGLRAHIKCGEVAPRDCGLRAASSLTRIASAPQGTPGIGGKAKAKSPLPFSQR